MSCKKFKESIYLYDELSPEERRMLDEHLRECASCRILLNEVQAMTKSIKVFSSLRPVPQNNASLTHTIMADIERSQQESIGLLDRLFSFPTLRYSLAGLSIVMVISFVAEHNIAQNQTYAKSTVQVSELSSVLNTNHFLKTMEISRGENVNKKHFSISLCLSTGTCDQLSYFKTKKNHEEPH